MLLWPLDKERRELLGDGHVADNGIDKDGDSSTAGKVDSSQGGDSTSNAVTSHFDIPQAINYRCDVAIRVVEPIRANNGENRVGTGNCIERRRVVRSHMILDEYDYQPRGTPRSSVHCGSIEQLAAAHRLDRQARKIDRNFSHLWQIAKRRPRIEQRQSMSQGSQGRGGLVLKMSKRGASPDDWMLLRMLSWAAAKQRKWPFRQATPRNKGADTQLLGAEWKSFDAWQQHVQERVSEIYIRHGMKPPRIERIRSGVPHVPQSSNVRCRKCASTNRSLLECIGKSRCATCQLKGIICVSGRKRAPAERDRLRIGVLRDAAFKHLPGPAKS